VEELVRRNLRLFILGATTALLLRAIFILRFPGVVNDSFIYGDIAKNWLQHGIYGLSVRDGISPTLIRLPGYPAFLAFIFMIFGADHYRAVLVVQALVDLGTCFLSTSIALRLFGARAAKVTFLLTALCPFLANYSAAALTETLEVFCTVLAIDLACKGLAHGGTRTWGVCGLACGAALLLRPDGALLPLVIGLYLAWQLGVGTLRRSRPRAAVWPALVLVAGLSVLPLAPWTVRNWHVFHRFQPLAPRYANEETEWVPMGFNHWVKTWIADYASVEEIYWQVSGNAVDPARLPSRAFDTPEQRNRTIQLIAEYNVRLQISPLLDSRFEALARERSRTHPMRTYLGLPVLRILDMWLRPRTEMLPCDTRWWEFNDEPRWSVLAVSLGVIGLFYVLAGLVGWLSRPPLAASWLLLLFVVLRSAFLSTLENPEPRYTLEMYPVLIVFAAAALGRKIAGFRLKKEPARSSPVSEVANRSF
jgi:4-amino-4-deoxy-L-arabinose transferase-like glycosyltransferase